MEYSDYPGLCGRCRYTRVLHNDRLSTFWMCERSREDDTFPRYPRLPVVVCRGFIETSTCDEEPGDV